MKQAKTFLKSVFILFLLQAHLAFQGQSVVKKGNLKVIVIKMRNNSGQVGYFLFKTLDGFPNHFDKSIASAYVKTNIASTEYVFRDIDFGTFAVCVFHDENSDKKINSNFIGMPKEGIGVSNNAKGHFGAPKYEDAKFELNKPEQTITISLSYL
jgi:uncharacterized protein (DUF2141 family)